MPPYTILSHISQWRTKCFVWPCNHPKNPQWPSPCATQCTHIFKLYECKLTLENPKSYLPQICQQYSMHSNESQLTIPDSVSVWRSVGAERLSTIRVLDFARNLSSCVSLQAIVSLATAFVHHRLGYQPCKIQTQRGEVKF